jgi:hypothetical protein
VDPTPRLPDAAASSRGIDLAIGPTGVDHEAARSLRAETVGRSCGMACRRGADVGAGHTGIRCRLRPAGTASARQLTRLDNSVTEGGGTIFPYSSNALLGAGGGFTS